MKTTNVKDAATPGHSQGMLDAWSRAGDLREHISHRRNGKPLSSSVQVIRRIREEHADDL